MGGLLDNIKDNIGEITEMAKTLFDDFPTIQGDPDRLQTINATVNFLTRPDIEDFIPKAKVLKGERELTVGHGITGPEFERLTKSKLKNGDRISDLQSRNLTAKIVSEKQPLVESIARRARKNGVEIGPNQKAVLTSLIFNVGQKAFMDSDALKALIRGDRDEFMRQAFDRKEGFVKQTIRDKKTKKPVIDPKTGKPKKKILRGLVNRRLREQKAFITPSKPSQGFFN